MKKQKKRFVLAEANVSEVSKQLTITLWIIIALVFLLGLNTVYFSQEKSVFSVALMLLIIVLIYLIAKSREILKIKKQELAEQDKAIDNV